MIISSMDIAISWNFILSMLDMFAGLYLATYVVRLYWAEKKGKDFSHYLSSKVHCLLMRCFSIPGAKLFVAVVSISGSLILVLMALDAWGEVRSGGSLKFLAWHEYLTWKLGIGAVLFGACFLIATGDKGLLLPLGSGLAVSFDKGNSLAFHLSDDKPNLRKIVKLLPASVKKLREAGVKNPLVFKSWIFVAQADKNDAQVILVRKHFRQVQWFGNFVNRQRWLKIADNIAIQKIVMLILPVFAAPLYAILFWRPIKKCLSQTPPAALRDRTLILAEALGEATGGTAALIEPSAVSPMMLINLAIKLPAISEDFGGQHGGFVLSSAG